MQALFINAGAQPATPRRSIDSPSMVGKRAKSAEERKPVAGNPLAVKHRIWYGDCPGMVGQRHVVGDAPRDTKRTTLARSKKSQCSPRCVQLSNNESQIAPIPGQLLAALEEGAEHVQLSQLRQKIRDRLMSQTPGYDFVTLKQLESELCNRNSKGGPPNDEIGLEQFHKVAQEELMALMLTLEGAKRQEIQLAYTQWHKEKDHRHQKEERTKFARYLQRQEEDIERRREKVIVVEEATGQYLDGIMQRKSRKFWPTSFMREMNMRVKKKLAHQKFKAALKPKQKMTNEPTFSTF